MMKRFASFSDSKPEFSEKNFSEFESKGFENA